MNKKKENILEFIIYPEILLLDVTGPLEVFCTANDIIGSDYYRPVFTSNKKGLIKTSSGLSILAENDFRDNINSDMLIIPGGNNIENVINDEIFMNYIKMKIERADKVVSICMGVFILAASGYLSERKATTHWACTGELKDKFPDIKVKPDLIFTKDDKFYSSAGVTTGIDLALSLVEEDHGSEISLEIAKRLVLYYKRPGSQSQYSSVIQSQSDYSTRFSTLYNWIEKNINKQITVEQMADISNMSARNFARIFKEKTGNTPGNFLLNIRLDKARELIESGDWKLSRVAVSCGFRNEEHLRRAFLRKYSITPSQYRVHFGKK